MSDPSPTVTVVVCTRDRPELLDRTLSALRRESAAAGIDVMVVDQGDGPAPAPGDSLTHVRDYGTGLSRARNVALGRVESEWIAFVDDDCVVEEGFGPELVRALANHPEADWLSGDVSDGGGVNGDGPPVTTFPVTAHTVVHGRWSLPGRIGFGVFFCVRTATARRLGGWDERLGPGVPDFPAADDMDFNYRLLRSGGLCVLSPDVRAVHHQWRDPGQVEELTRGYLRAWSGFAAKHLRRGDVAGGVWLWSWGAIDVLHMAMSAVRRRSGTRARLARAKLRGLREGTDMGLGRRW
jgi:GT2 family glycosyltransferase